MANQTVYPYGTNGELPSSIGLINDLTTGGVDRGLTAEQGKKLTTKNLFEGKLLTFSVNNNTNTIVWDSSLNAIVITKNTNGYFHIGMLPGVAGDRYRVTFDITFSNALTGTQWFVFTNNTSTSTGTNLGGVSFLSGDTQASVDYTTTNDGVKFLRANMGSAIPNGTTITITNLKAVLVDPGYIYDSFNELENRVSLDDSNQYGEDLSSEIIWETNATTHGDFVEDNGSIVIRKYSSAAGFHVGFKTDFLTAGHMYRMRFRYRNHGVNAALIWSYDRLGGSYSYPGCSIPGDEEGEQDFYFHVNPISGAYLCVALNNMSTYGALRLWDISIKEVLYPNTKLDNSPRYTYYGERVVPQKHTMWQSSEMGFSPTLGTGAGQGAASFGKYLFYGYNGNKRFDIYDLESRELLGYALNDISGESNNHSNSMSFGPYYYDSNDEFPILWTSTGYSTGDNYYAYGYRIVKTDDGEGNITWSSTLVQTITIPVSVKNGTWCDLICSPDRQDAYLIGGQNDFNYLRIVMPKYTDGDVTISTEDILDSMTPSSKIIDLNIASSRQGILWLGNKLYLVHGQNNTTQKTYFRVIDTFTGKEEVLIPLAEIGIIAEPEFVIYYDNHLFIGTRTNLYRLFFD